MDYVVCEKDFKSIQFDPLSYLKKVFKSVNYSCNNCIQTFRIYYSKNIPLHKQHVLVEMVFFNAKLGKIREAMWGKVA